jgi:hypothetical protein
MRAYHISFKERRYEPGPRCRDLIAEIARDSRTRPGRPRSNVSSLIWQERGGLFLEDESRENAVQVRLINHSMTQLARLAGLLKHVRPDWRW